MIRYKAVQHSHAICSLLETFVLYMYSQQHVLKYQIFSGTLSETINLL